MAEVVAKERNINLDILRILACFFVVLAHISSENIDTMSVQSADWAISHIYNSIGHTGTILFFLISGSLLLSENYHFIPKRFFKNNFLNLFVAYYSWILIYHIIGFIQRGNWGWIYVKDVIINVIKGEASYHFWYLPMLLGIYLILPMLRAICKDGQGLVTYFVVLFGIVQIIFGTVLYFDFPHKYLLESLMTRIPFTLVTHHVGYFVMGYLLMRLVKEEKFSRSAGWIGVLLFLGGVIGGLVGDRILSAQRGSNSVQFNSLFSLTLCISAVGLFVMINNANIKVSEHLKKTVTKLAGLTFGIYMLHPLVLDLVRGISAIRILPKALEIPVLSIVAFGLCGLVVWLISFIPGIKKWVLFMR